MRQTKKAGQWRFGLKCRICLHAGSGPVQTINSRRGKRARYNRRLQSDPGGGEAVLGGSGYWEIQTREETDLMSGVRRLSRRPRNF